MTRFVNSAGFDPFSWSANSSEGPGPWEPNQRVGKDALFPEIDFWPSDKTLVSLGKIDKDGDIENNFLFENKTETLGAIDGPIDYNGRFSILRHDNYGELEMDVNVGTNDAQTNAFNVTLTVIPISGPVQEGSLGLYKLHIGGRFEVSEFAEAYNTTAPQTEVSLQQGTMMTHAEGWRRRPKGSMKIDELIDIERIVEPNGAVKYGVLWEVEELDEANPQAGGVIIPYGLTWYPMEND